MLADRGAVSLRARRWRRRHPPEPSASRCRWRSRLAPPRRHRRVLRRRDHQQGSQRHRPDLERVGGADVRLQCRRDGRRVDPPADPAGSPGRGRRHAGPHSPRRSPRPLRDHPPPQGWIAGADLADRVADPRRRRADRRRLEDRPRHLAAAAHRARARATAAGDGGRRRDAERGRRHRRRHARSGDRRPGGDRCRDRIDDRRVRRLLLQRRQRQRRGLHPLHHLRRPARGVREVPDAAQHAGVRADLQGRPASSAATTSPPIRGTATTRRTTACRRGTCRCAAISRCR